MSTVKVNQWLNPDGTENYKCRAWVNFNGMGVVAIRASANVSSITDNGIGDYTANFINAMSDVNYCVVAGNGDAVNFTTTNRATVGVGGTRLVIFRYDGSMVEDSLYVNIAIFR
jgi:hypothetical protein